MSADSNHKSAEVASPCRTLSTATEMQQAHLVILKFYNKALSILTSSIASSSHRVAFSSMCSWLSFCPDVNHRQDTQ